MLRLKAFRPSSEKIVKIQLHPTHPWMVTADASDSVSVWNWEHRQVIYELKAGGVDERRFVGAKLEKLAEGETESKGKPTEAMRGGSVKQVGFYDDDVRFWQLWHIRSAAAEAPSAVDHVTSATSFPAPATKGRHFLIVCCENKAIFLDLVTMRGRDVPKQELDNKSLLCMDFLFKSSVGDGPLVAFGGSDGVIRVLSMITWKLVRRYAGGHKGSVSCLMTFMGCSGEALLVSGASDGLLILWSADHGRDSLDLIPKISLKAHDGGVVAVELSRVIGNPPHVITIGADKTLAIWDTVSFKELRRIKPVPKLACYSVASWSHPRAPNLDILTCAKDSHIWAIEHSNYSALTRPLCELTSLLPPQVFITTKKLRVYCMVAHPLQPHLVATGTNVGVIFCDFDARSLPPVAPLPTPPESREHSAVYVDGRELKLLKFQLSNMANPSLVNISSLSEAGRSKGDSFDPLHIKQLQRHISTHVPHDSYSVLSVSSSGKYMAIVWPDILYFSVYMVSDWSVVDSGSARFLAWDTCHDRFAILESALPPRIPAIPKGISSRKAKEAQAAAAQAAAVAASPASSASVQVRILLNDGSSNILMRSLGGHNEPVIGLHGGALLGVAYRTSRRIGPIAAAPFSTFGDGYHKCPFEAAHQNFQLYSWETFQPVGGLLPQPEWTAWDQTVEYCAFAYRHYIVISSLRPQYRYMGDVAIPHATSAVWQRRQLFVATPTTIEIVFVDAGVTTVDIETRKMKEELKLKEAQAQAVAEHGELALITVDSPQADMQERISLRTPMLQVVRLASFQHAPAVPPFLILPKQSKMDGDDIAIFREVEERKVNEVAVGGGGVSVAVTRFPTEQKRPVGPLIVVGVRDGVLWLIDRYMCLHALSLSHPGIRCRCLAAYGDPVSTVKWASRLGREHHDDLAQFMLGMGYATEALHLPGISKRLEFDLAIKSNDLKRALQCLLTMSNSRDIGHDSAGLNLTDILNLTAKKENVIEAVQGIVKFTEEFLVLIDAADATAQGEIAREALKRLAAAGSMKGTLQGHELRGLALRLANHGELTRLSGFVNNLISLGMGREAAFAAAVLGDNVLMEKAWKDTGMLTDAVLHAHAHGRPTLRNLVEEWNQVLQKEVEPAPSKLTHATAAFLASLEEPKLTGLGEAGEKPPIEILPPGMMSLYAPISFQKKPASATKNSQQQLGKTSLVGPSNGLVPPPTAAAAPPTATDTEAAATPPIQTESAATPSDQPHLLLTSESTSPPAPAAPELESGETIAPQVDSSETIAPQVESSETNSENKAPDSPSVNNADPLAADQPTEEASASNPAPSKVPPQAPEVQETTDTTVPATSMLE